MYASWRYRILVALLAAAVAIAVMATARMALAQVGAGIPVSFLDDSKADKPEGKEKDEQVVTSKASKRVLATTIDFRKAHGLPFDSLRTLGSRIEAARRKPDPVALAHAASELRVAEKLSGTTASLTSTALLAEAKELAALRRKVAELKVVLAIHQQIASEETKEEDQVNFWKTKIALAEKTAQEEQDALAKKAPVEVPRMVLVNNLSSQSVDVWINGCYNVDIPAGTSKWCVVEHNWDPTTLTATGDEDGRSWGPRWVRGAYKTYTWNLE
jgi:hypothetical protein